MLGILVAVVIGLVIAFVYTLVSKKDGYNKSFIIGLALLLQFLTLLKMY